jgi:hypothetical protein
MMSMCEMESILPLHDMGCDWNINIAGALQKVVYAARLYMSLVYACVSVAT